MILMGSTPVCQRNTHRERETPVARGLYPGFLTRLMQELQVTGGALWRFPEFVQKGPKLPQPLGLRALV